MHMGFGLMIGLRLAEIGTLLEGFARHFIVCTLSVFKPNNLIDFF